MFNNLNLKIRKVLVIFLIITLTYANFVLIGSNVINGLISYAVEDEEAQPTLVANQILLGNQVKEINGVEKRVIQVQVESGIAEKEHPIKQTTLTLDTNIIEGTLEDVKITEVNKISYTSGSWQVSETGELTITLVNENETLESKPEGTDILLVTYVFQENETELESIKQPLQKVEVTKYAGEVLSTELENGNFENVSEMEILTLLSIYGEDIHKTTIKEGQVEVIENLMLDLSYRKDTLNIKLEDTLGQFYNNNDDVVEGITSEYKTTIINKNDLTNLLGDNGKLKIYDVDTGKEIIELTKENLASEKSVKQYYTEEGQRVNDGTKNTELRSEFIVAEQDVVISYSIKTTKIKIELTNIKEQSESQIDISSLEITNTKHISNITDLENLKKLEESVKYVTEYVEEDELVSTEGTEENTINFKDTITKAKLDVDNTEWVVGEANKVKYTITLDTTTEKAELFVSPMFLIELPATVDSINTENSEFTVNNDGGAFNSKKVFVTTVLGRKFVVLNLQGTQTSQTIQDGDTTIDLTLELHVKEGSTEGNQTTKLYYQNNTVTAYESDMSFDTDEVTVEMVLENEPKYEIEENVERLVFNLYSSVTDEGVIQENEEFYYDLYVLNEKSEAKQNLEITGTIPEGVSIIKTIELDNYNFTKKDIEYSFDENTRKFTINIEQLDGTVKEEEKTIYGYKHYQIILKADELPEGTNSKEIKCTMELLQGEKVLATSKEIKNTIGIYKIETKIDELPKTLNELEEIELNIKMENKGELESTKLSVSIDMPEEIALNEYAVTIFSEEGKEIDSFNGKAYGDYSINYIVLEPHTIYNLKLKGMVNYIEADKDVTIKGIVNGEEYSWTIKLLDIMEEPEDKPDEPNTPENPDDIEKPGDTENPEGGEKPSNPDDENNPVDPDDNKPVNPDDSEKEEGNTQNETEGFDLSLNQYLSKATVTNSKGTTTYEYTDTNFAKLEIHSKQMNGSKVTLEYNIVIENKGTVPGYARKLVDYIPSDLKFNKDLNPDWYEGDDGNIYSVKLLNTILNPGDRVELKIILEKQMTNENIGTITNIVEIYEASNDEEVEDINSIPGDRAEGQNDISKVEVMIVTSTGTIILYTALAITTMAIIGLGFYKVRKITLNKKGGC